MATTFDVIFLGNISTQLDPNEGNANIEDASAIVGSTYGSSGNPLSANVQSFSPGSTGFAGGDSTGYDVDNNVANDTFSINGGADQTFDAMVIYNATVTYVDGTTATITSTVFQDTAGNLYLAPEASINTDQTALEAGAIRSLTLDSVANATTMSADRVAGTYVETDGLIDGSAGDDTIGAGYFDAQGDIVSAGADIIDGGAGNDFIQALDGDDTVLGGLGSDTIEHGLATDIVDGGEGDDRIVNVDGTISGQATTIDGGTGTDTYVLDNDRGTFTGNHTVNLAAGEVRYNGVFRDSLISIENVEIINAASGVIGDANANVITATGNFSNSLSGGDGNDTIDGGGGADTLLGDEGRDLIFGGDGNDVIDGGTRSDTIYGGAGNDSITDSGGSASDDIIYGEAGNDTIAGGLREDYIDGGDDADLLFGDEGDDTILGGAGNDTIDGGAGNDSLSGGAGNDRFATSAGADTIIGGTGQDIYQGADGFTGDVIDFGAGDVSLGDGGVLDLYSVTTSVDFVFTSGTGGTATSGAGEGLTFEHADVFQGAWGSGGTFDAQLSDYGVIYYDYGGTTSAIGSAHDDWLVAFEADPVGITDRYFDGGAGNDSIDTGNGNDTIIGGDGNDTIVSRSGDDFVDGGAGDDDIYDFDGDSSLIGGAGNDTIDGQGGADVLAGGTGNDLLDGDTDGDTFLVENGFGADTIIGGEGVTTGTDYDTIDLSALTTGVTVDWTGAESGTITSGANSIAFSEVEHIIFTNNADTIDATAETASINIDGAGGNDRLTGGSGNDTIDGGDGNDRLDGGAGNDSLDGGAGNDRIYVTGADTVTGGLGSDQITILDGFGGSTVDFGGDAIVVDSSAYGEQLDLWSITSSVTVTFTSGTTGTLVSGSGETLTFSNAEEFGSALDQDAYFDARLADWDINFSDIGTNSTVYGSAFDDTITFGGSTAAGLTARFYDGGAGNDYLSAGNGDDTLLGGAGNDTVDGSEGNESLDGGTGDDTVSGWHGADTISGGAGNDLLQGQNDADTFLVENGFGADTILGGEGVTTGADIDTIDLSAVTVPITVTFTGNGAGTITNGTDTIAFSEIERLVLSDNADVADLTGDLGGIEVIAGNGADTITGGAGADTISGGDGNNVIDGAGGDDSILTGTGNDSIQGGDGNDTIDGGRGNDTIDGGAGDDVLVNTGGSGTRLLGGDGNDTLTGSTGNRLEGGAGNDSIFGKSGVMIGGAGDDTVEALHNGGWATFHIDNADGNDVLIGLEGGNVDNLMFFTTTSTEGVTVTYTTGSDGSYVFNGLLGTGSGTFTSMERVDGTENADVYDLSAATGENWGVWTHGGDDLVLGSAFTDGITTAEGNNTVYGGDGDDYIETYNDASGNDLLFGGDGDDNIGLYGSGGETTVDGGAGNDYLWINNGAIDATYVLQDGFGNDTISATTSNTDTGAGDGIDASALTNGITVSFVSATDGLLSEGANSVEFEGVDFLNLTAQADSFDGTLTASSFVVDAGAGNDTLTGGIGSDTLTGGEGADSIVGSGASTASFVAVGNGDTVTATAGSDDLTWTGAPGETSTIMLDGGAGTANDADGVADRIFVEGTGNGSTLFVEGLDWNVDKIFVSEQWTGMARTTIGAGHHEVTLTYASGDTQTFDIQHTSGSSFFPTYVFDVGGPGGDLIDGGDGNDTVTGSDYADSILGGLGNDSLIGGAGDDTLAGGYGDDYIDGGDGDDFLTTGLGQDTLVGGAGNDTLMNSDGDDLLIGGAGDDSIVATGGNDTLDGGDGNDTLVGGADSDLLIGGAGDDSMDGGDDGDTFLIEDFFGNDTIIGGEGTTTGTDFDIIDLSNLTGPVTVTFTDEEDGTITNGTDTITFSEIERLILTESNDSVDASIVHDGLTGDAAGVDIDARGGDDTIIGGRGGDTIDGGTGNDFIDGDYGDDSLHGGDGNDTVTGGSGNDTIFGGIGDDNIDGGIEADTIDGGAGNDTIIGGSGDDSISGGDGADTISAGSGNDTVDGGAGNDTIDGSFGNDSLDGGDGNDTVWGSSGNDTMRGGAGADSMHGGNNDDSLDGGADNDSLLGGNGNDVLEGGGGNDTLQGGNDNDTLSGGAGDDRLSGEGGNDTFIFTPGEGNDTITDFNSGNTGALGDGNTANNDFINLSAYYTNLVELRADFDDDGVLNQSDGGDYTDNSSMGGGSMTFSGTDRSSFASDNTGVVCFTTGTAIRTPRGDILIENLAVGDLVMTADNGPQPIHWIGTRTLNHKELIAAPNLRPVLIDSDVLGNTRPLLVSPQHCMMLGDQLARAKHLAETHPGVRIANGKRQVCYVHLMFEAHQIIFAENAPSESFYPGPMSLKTMLPPARREIFALLPDLCSQSNDRAITKSQYGETARAIVKMSALPEMLKSFAN